MGYESNDYFEDNTKKLNGFDKFCCVLAGILGLIFVVLGCMGIFMNVNANFSLPPILGILPGFVGWGILKAIYVSW